MPLLSTMARKRKSRIFLRALAPESQSPGIGCGDGWVGHWLKSHGYPDYVGMDLDGSKGADIAGDIRNWARPGMALRSFHVIVAFDSSNMFPACRNALIFCDLAVYSC
jgi:hypothetical protein